MDTYSFWADVMTTFRSSSDLVKIIWLLTPMLLVLALVFAAVKLHWPWAHSKPAALPLMTFQTGAYGTVTVVRTEAGLELLSLDEEGTLAPLLHISRNIMNRIGIEKTAPDTDSNKDTPAMPRAAAPET